MKVKLLLLALFVSFFSSGQTTLAAWDFFGENTANATSSAEIYNVNLDGSNLISRGGGAAASAAGNSFRTTGFQNNGISTANTDYFQITLSSTTGNNLSLSTIDARFAGTASFAASPGVSNQFAYSLDGTNFTLVGSPQILIGSPAVLTQIDLTGISALQNVSATTSITLRFYASGQTTTGGWGFNSPSLGSYGLSIRGSVTSSCTAPADPPGPITVSANPSCGAATLSHPAGYYWQTTATGTSTAFPTSSNYSLASSGTIFVRAYDGVSCWSTGSLSSGAIVINSPISITTQPSNTSITAGSNTSFTVTASNVTGYQWQVDTGSGFANLGNDATYSNVNGATLNITGATLAMNGYQYQCVLNAISPCTAVTSSSATLTVGAPPTPVISSSLTKSNVYGTADTYTITASNTPTSYSTGILPTGFTLSGAVITKANNVDAGTYNIDISATNGSGTDTQTLVWTITPKPLTITGLTGDNKVYDGLTTATLSGTATLNGVVFADDVTISGTPTSNFVDKNVGTGKAITITGYTLGGTKAANYSVSQPTGVSANITAKPLSVTAPTIASKVYNGSAVSGAVSVGTITGFVGTETVTATATGVYADANAGTGKSATVTYVLANGTNGGLATNYSLAVGTGTGDITQATPVFTTSAIAVSVGGTYTLPGANVTSTSPGALTYSITSGGFATLTGSTITGVSVGSETVTVTQAASTNYLGGSTTVGVNVTTITYVNGDYRTINNGNWHSTTASGSTNTWEQLVAGVWTTISNSPPSNAAGLGTRTVYIRHTIILIGTNTAPNVIVDNGGVLNTSTVAATFGNLLVRTGGIFNRQGNGSGVSGVFEVEDNATVNFYHTNTTSRTTSIWAGTERFHTNSNFILKSADNTSNFLIIQTNNDVSEFNGSCFGNLIVDLEAGQLQLLPAGFNKVLANNLIFRNNTGNSRISDSNYSFSVLNNFEIESTYANTLSALTTAGTATINIGGNFIHNGSSVFRLANNATAIITLNIDGNLQVNSGTFDLNFASGATSTINLEGDLTVATAAILFAANNNIATFNFTGIGDGTTNALTQTINVVNQATASNINFNVNSGSYTKLINQDFALGTNSAFTVRTGGIFDFGFNGTTALNLVRVTSQTQQSFVAQTGSTLKITSPLGITSFGDYTGNVQIGATAVTNRLFDVGATYHYIGKANQVSGNALPLGITGKVIVELDTDALVFNASGNKTIATAGTLEIIRGIVEDTSTDSFGNLASNAGNLTMSGGRYRIFKASTQPDLSGTYNLTAGVIEFAGPLNKTIRSPKSYQNIEVTGTDVGNSSGNITLNSAGTFTVKTGGIFTINDNSIVGPTGTQTVTVENGAIFKTGDVEGFNGSNLTSIQPTIESIILANGSTVEYSRATTTGDQTITLYSPAYRNLTISGTGVKTLQDDTATRVEEDLRIDSAKLLLTINQILTVKEGVSIAATGAEFELDNNAQLIQIDEVDTNVGTNFKLKRLAFVHAQDYVYWSSPVFGFDVGLIPTQQRYFWNPINGNTNGTVGNWNGATGTDAIMPVGKGYIVNSGSGFPIRPLPTGNLETNFVGRPNNGTLTSTIQRGSNGASIDDNWNLVGNPYPSAIFAEEFLDANNTKINGSVWVWTHGQAPDNATDPFYDNFGANYYATDYLKYNKLGATDTTFNGIIASGQGFMVNMLNTTPSTSETVTFTNAMRTDATATPYNNAGFYRTANTNLTVANPEEKHRIWLSIINTAVGQKESALLGYSANSTLAADHFYDCIYVPRTEVGIYTLVNTGEYVIQGRPLPFLDSDLVPMGVKIVTAGSHKIAIKKVDGLFEGNQGIYLEDTVLGIVHDLKAAPYTFTSEVGVFNSRFIVRYTPSALSNDDFDSLDNNVFVSTQSTDVSIKSANELMSSVLVYDILGRELVRKNNINANDITLPNVSAVNQALIVKITLENGQVVTRKIIL